MVIEVRQRSPLGAPYRTPLGAFGKGVAAPVENYTFQIAFAENRERYVKQTSPCGIGIPVNPGPDAVVQITMFLNGANVPYQEKYLGFLKGRTIRGSLSGTTTVLGGADINLFCQSLGTGNGVWEPGFSSSAAFFATTASGGDSAELQFFINSPNPGWIQSESAILI